MRLQNFKLKFIVRSYVVVGKTFFLWNIDVILDFILHTEIPFSEAEWNSKETGVAPKSGLGKCDCPRREIGSIEYAKMLNFGFCLSKLLKTS